jgi:NTP pyrophosphatase (non-canonical NTP hydrolase)
MTFDEYQQQALTTALVHPDPLLDRNILVLGIAGEAGEVVEKWKKIMAYKDGQMDDADIQEMSKELGDVMWYIAVFAHNLGLSFEDVMQQNISKLKSRQARNLLKGSGDNR